MVKAESHQTRGVLTTGAQGPGGQDVLRTRILQPLGLTHTIFPTTAAMPSPHLHGYSVQGGPPTEANTATNTSVEWAAGAMISTLADLHTWAQAVATGRLLSPALQKQRLTLSPPSVAFFRHRGVAGGYGLGIAKLSGLIGHTGELPGFNTDAWYLPAFHATIVVIVHSDAPVQAQGPAEHLTQQLVKIVSALQRAA